MKIPKDKLIDGLRLHRGWYDHEVWPDWYVLRETEITFGRAWVEFCIRVRMCAERVFGSTKD